MLGPNFSSVHDNIWPCAPQNMRLVYRQHQGGTYASRQPNEEGCGPRSKWNGLGAPRRTPEEVCGLLFLCTKWMGRRAVSLVC